MKDTEELTARANLLKAVCAESGLSIGAAARLWGIPADTLYQATAGRRATDDLLCRVAEQAKGDGPATVRLHGWAAALATWRTNMQALAFERPYIWPWGQV